MKFDARRNSLLALFAAVVAAGCQSFPYLAGPKQEPINQTAPPVSQLGAPDETYTSQWEAGRAIYVGACTSCHQPKPIRDIAIDQWKEKIIPRMSAKAKLTPEQSQSLEEYVMAVKRSQLVGGEHPKSGLSRLLTSPVSAADNR